MYKLCIALGWPVIRMYLQNTYQVSYPELLNRIRQHRFIWSDNIDNYYSNNAEKEGLIDEYQTFIESALGNDQYIAVRDKADINQTIANYLKKSTIIGLIISENEEFNVSRSSCRYQYSIEEAEEDLNGPLGMYSVKADFSVNKGEKADLYLEWIKNMISGEKEISIIDPYLLDKDINYKSLVKYFFPVIPRNSKVHLHVKNNSPFLDQVQEEAEKSFITLIIHRYHEMNHCRYITTSSKVMTIGVGMDFMKSEGGHLVFRTGFNTAVRWKKKNLPYMAEEYELAGRLVGD